MYSCGSSGDSGNAGIGSSAAGTGSSNLPAGTPCANNASCASGLCFAGTCSSGQPGGTNCTSNADCTSGVCTSGACSGNGLGVPSGGACASNGQCASGTCTNGACAGGSGLPDGKSCGSSAECASGACTNGVCGTGSGSGGPDASVGGGGANGGGGVGTSGSSGTGTSGSSGTGTSGSSGNAGSTGGPGGGANGTTCTSDANCASGLCAGGVCVAPTGTPGSGTTTGPQFGGSGSGFRPLVAGCGPSTASDCTGACEQSGGDPNVTVIRPPATLCFASPDDLTPNDPAVVIEQSIETLNGVTYVHIRITFDPSFVDNVYGTDSNRTDSGWHMRGGPTHIYGHTFNPDLVKSDHTEILLTDATGATVISFHQDYISADPSQPCGYGSLGVTGGDGTVTMGDPTKILAVTTSLERNLNGCGYCTSGACAPSGDCTIDSPTTDATYTPNPITKNWDYRVVYEMWIDATAFGSAGFGQAYMTYVHASPNKSTLVSLNVTPTPCPPTWDKPYCPPSVIQEGGNCFGSPPPGGGGSGGGGGVPGAGGAGNGGTAGTAGNGGNGGGSVNPCPVNWQIYISSEGKSSCTPIPFANYPGMTPCPAGYTLDVASEGRYCLPSP